MLKTKINSKLTFKDYIGKIYDALRNLVPFVQLK